MRTLAALLLAFVLTLTSTAAEPWLKPNDVVALIGGEDMVALAEEGWLETIVTLAQPKDHIRFRSLAWEGDTVFEQQRDLNYPTLETQLDKMGATVVICQFGKMESFAGKEGVAAFTEAYEKLLARLNPEGKRRVALVLPSRMIPFKEYIRWNIENDDKEKEELRKHGIVDTRVRPSDILQGREKVLAPHFRGHAMLERLPDFHVRNDQLIAYRDTIRALAGKCSALIVESESPPAPNIPMYITADGIRVEEAHQRPRDEVIARGLVVVSSDEHHSISYPIRMLKFAIAAKNRAWFHYTRPQNWAFLAGNRMNQPSSRDHKDPTKRWFPEEMEQWLPLIEAKEQEIWKFAVATY